MDAVDRYNQAIRQDNGHSPQRTLGLGLRSMVLKVAYCRHKLFMAGIANLALWIYNRIYRKGGFPMKTLIVLPDALGVELKQTIPARQRSRFISEAVEKQLRSLKFKKILKQTAGTWTDKNHPDMKTQAGINRHLGRIRGWN